VGSPELFQQAWTRPKVLERTGVTTKRAGTGLRHFLEKSGTFGNLQPKEEVAGESSGKLQKEPAVRQNVPEACLEARSGAGTCLTASERGNGRGSASALTTGAPEHEKASGGIHGQEGGPSADDADRSMDGERAEFTAEDAAAAHACMVSDPLTWPMRLET
jgi:hypothetical protein